MKNSLKRKTKQTKMIWRIKTTLTIWISAAVVAPTLNHKAKRVSTKRVEV